MKDQILEPRIIAITAVRQVDSGPTLRSGASHRANKVTQYLCNIEGLAKKKILDKTRSFTVCKWGRKTEQF